MNGCYGSAPCGSGRTLENAVQRILVEDRRFAAVDDTHDATCAIAVGIVDIPDVRDDATFDGLLVDGLVEQTDAGIVLLLNGTVGELTPVGTILAEDDGIAFISETLLHHIELFPNISLLTPRTIILGEGAGRHMIGRTPEIEGLVPIGTLPDASELWGTIIMHLNHQRILGRVVEPTHVNIFTRQFDAGIRTLHDECARGIVAACGTHGIDKRLFVGHQHTGLRLGLCLRLVESGKEQALIVILESLGYLSP